MTSTNGLVLVAISVECGLRCFMYDRKEDACLRGNRRNFNMLGRVFQSSKILLNIGEGGGESGGMREEDGNS